MGSRVPINNMKYTVLYTKNTDILIEASCTALTSLNFQILIILLIYFKNYTFAH